jgi:hypothetical protein
MKGKLFAGQEQRNIAEGLIGQRDGKNISV